MVSDCTKTGWAHRDSLLLAGGWLAGFALLARLPGLPPFPAPGEERAPDACAELSVVIPARNEERNLGRLLASLARQQPAPAEVIVVDDCSTDATAELARRAGVTVVAGTEPEAGWSGKCWACHQGATAASKRLLVFLDADVTLSPDALGRLAAEHHRRGGLLSIAPFHRTERPYEGLSAVANLVALMGTGAFGLLAGSPTMAFGPCMIMTADDYRATGGHAHPDVRGAVTEDAALAQRFRTLGLPLSVLAGRDAVSFRMYPDGAASLLDGWTRSLAAGAERTPVPLAAAIALWVTGALLAGFGPARPGRGRSAFGWYGAFSLQMWWMLRRVGRFGALSTVAFPLPLSTFVAIFVRSAGNRLLGRSPTWRGRRMPAT